jgi:hypothetical protein
MALVMAKLLQWCGFVEGNEEDNQNSFPNNGRNLQNLGIFCLGVTRRIYLVSRSYYSGLFGTPITATTDEASFSWSKKSQAHTV